MFELISWLVVFAVALKLESRFGTFLIISKILVSQQPYLLKYNVTWIKKTFLWWGKWKFQQAKNWLWSKRLGWFVIDLNQSNDSLRVWITLTWLTQWCYVTKWTSVMVLLLYFKDCETYINVVTDWLFIWLCEVKIKTYQTPLCTWPSQDGQHAPLQLSHIISPGHFFFLV